jgi:hypothetical protein
MARVTPNHGPHARLDNRVGGVTKKEKKKKKKTPKNEVEVEVAEKDTAGNAVERQAAHFEGR